MTLITFLSQFSPLHGVKNVKAKRNVRIIFFLHFSVCVFVCGNYYENAFVPANCAWLHNDKINKKSVTRTASQSSNNNNKPARLQTFWKLTFRHLSKQFQMHFIKSMWTNTLHSQNQQQCINFQWKYLSKERLEMKAMLLLQFELSIHPCVHMCIALSDWKKFFWPAFYRWIFHLFSSISFIVNEMFQNVLFS